ncbi:MAG: hypothetical protein AAGD92_15730 [Pseudomonadota bacterium]
MAFPATKSDPSKKSVKRSPIAGWLGRKGASESADEIPQIDIAAGLTRALKKSQLAIEKPVIKDEESPVRDALGAIEAALYAIDKIRETLEQASEIAISAKDVDDAGGRALLAERYDEVRLSIDKSVETVDPRAASLIGANHRHMDVNLGGKTRYSVSPARMDTSEAGLNLSPPRDAFESDAEVEAKVAEIDNALGRADRAAAGYCRDAQYLIARMNGAFE